jgi:hypothetical protein
LVAVVEHGLVTTVLLVVLVVVQVDEMVVQEHLLVEPERLDKDLVVVNLLDFLQTLAVLVVAVVEV